MSPEGQHQGISIEEGSLFDEQYRNLLWAVDVAEGDDPQSDSITDHGQVDADARKHELQPPSVYAKKKAGMSPVDIAQSERLFELPEMLLRELDRADVDPDRKEMLVRSIKEAEIRLRHTFAGEIEGVTKPTFQETWNTVNGEEPPMISQFNGEIQATRDHMLTLLGQEGVHVTNPKTLRDRLMAWEHTHRQFGKGDEDAIAEMVKGGVAVFRHKMQQTMARVPALAGYAARLDGQQFQVNVLPEMNFDAGLSYIGGVGADGQPTGLSNFEWNAGRPATATDTDYIGTHEFTHAVNAYLMDMQRREGRLGPEAALLTMNSSRAGNEEGLAQTMKEMLAGGTLQHVIDQEGAETGIVMLQDRLQDIARIIAAVGWNQDFKNMPEEQRRLYIKQFIEQRLLQTDDIGYKYAGKHPVTGKEKAFWRKTPAGISYAGQYYNGSRAYREAIQQVGVERTLAVGMHTEGLVDLQTFKKKIARIVAGENTNG